jgi:probable F420-dependent oxidoreductase
LKFSCHLPVEKFQQRNEFLDGDAIPIMSRAAEDAGFSACAISDHPAPPTKWVEAGGHHALDPFVGLAFVGAATKHIKLHTNIVVAPYRNPFLMAKLVATLDRLSGGRLIMGIGTGYLTEEFDALGVPFEGRGLAVDEAIRLMKKIWAGDTINYTGATFKAKGVAALPGPLQEPHPPIWSGGNSGRAIRRAVELCDGWSPFPLRAAFSRNVHTESLENIEEFKKKLDYARGYAAHIGRRKELEICMIPFSLGLDPECRFEASKLIDECSELEALGVSWMTISLPCRDRSEFVGNTAWFGDEVISRFRRQ